MMVSIDRPTSALFSADRLLVELEVLCTGFGTMAEIEFVIIL